jgi:hypothetical protein
MYRLLALVLFGVGLTGCVPSIMVSTQKDTAYQLNKEMPLYVELGSDVGIPEKNTYNYLESALQSSGFSVVRHLADAKVVLTFNMTDLQYLVTRDDLYPYDFYAYRHYGFDYYPSYYPRTYVTDQKVIKLRLFDAAVYREGRRIPVWEAVVSGAPDTLETRLQETVDFLVNKIGEDFRGRVRFR